MVLWFRPSPFKALKFIPGRHFFRSILCLCPQPVSQEMQHPVSKCANVTSPLHSTVRRIGPEGFGTDSDPPVSPLFTVFENTTINRKDGSSMFFNELPGIVENSTFQPLTFGILGPGRKPRLIIDRGTSKEFEWDEPAQTPRFERQSGDDSRGILLDRWRGPCLDARKRRSIAGLSGLNGATSLEC